MSTQLIRISSETETPLLRYREQPVLIFSQIDALHGRPEGTAKAAFQRNRKRFIDGEDFYMLDSESLDVWRTEFPDMVGANAPSLTLITESGYLMLVKPFGNDLSWQIQRQLVKLYFRVKEMVQPPQPTLTVAQSKAFKAKVNRISVCCKFSGKAESALYESIRFTYGLRSVSELRPEQFDEVMSDLESKQALAEQHHSRIVALDEAFITAVLRPPVSISKVRAMVRRQEKQPLAY